MTKELAKIEEPKKGVLPKTAFKELRKLVKFDEIHEMLEAGKSVRQVARTIQISWGQMLGIQARSLEKQLQRYCEAECSGTVAANRFDFNFVDRIKAELGGEAQIVARMTWLINVQTKRISDLVEREEASRVPGWDSTRDPGLYKEMKEMREQITGLADFMFRAGLIKEAPKLWQGMLGVAGQIGVDLNAAGAIQDPNFQVNDEIARRKILHNATIRAFKETGLFDAGVVEAKFTSVVPKAQRRTGFSSLKRPAPASQKTSETPEIPVVKSRGSWTD